MLVEHGAGIKQEGALVGEVGGVAQVSECEGGEELMIPETAPAVFQVGVGHADDRPGAPPPGDGDVDDVIEVAGQGYPPGA